jgi:16S rRNA (uracil1498-N3)-methyltransferase
MQDTPSPTDFASPRLFVDAPLSVGVAVPIDRNQGNYLGNVLRLAAGVTVRAFNGRDGEWLCEIAGRKRPEALVPLRATRPQHGLADLTYAFAPLKHARLDYMAQKATEMGAARLQPVLTRHTQVSRLNLERMRANVVEAAEQCGILAIAEVAEPLPLPRWLAARPSDRLLVFCDESAPLADPLAALAGRKPDAGIDVLIGPEGGFSEDERSALQGAENVCVLSLGPRILRADTAAVAALTLVQAVIGDWRPL